MQKPSSPPILGNMLLETFVVVILSYTADQIELATVDQQSREAIMQTLAHYLEDRYILELLPPIQEFQDNVAQHLVRRGSTSEPFQEQLRRLQQILQHNPWATKNVTQKRLSGRANQFTLKPTTKSEWTRTSRN